MKDKAEEKSEDTTKKSLEEGQKAIDLNKHLENQSGNKEAETEEKKDAEKLRNEG